MLGKLFASLFGRRSISAEDVVFEPLEDPSKDTSVSGKGLGRSVPIEKLLERVPVKWRAGGEAPLHEVLVLPPEALISEEDPLNPRYSLRYLARFYPSSFRDPGVMEPDPGVVLPEEYLQDPTAGLKNPVAGLSTLPPDTVSEVVADPATFSDWEEERSGGAERAQERRETQKVLRGLRLPKADPGVSEGFNTALSRSEAQEQTAGERIVSGENAPGATREQKAPEQKTPEPVPNPRLRRILAAYAETLPEFTGAAEAADVEKNASVTPQKTETGPASQGDLQPPRREKPIETEKAEDPGAMGSLAPAQGAPGRVSVQIPLRRGGGAATGGAPGPGRGVSGEGSAPTGGFGGGEHALGGKQRWETRFAELGRSLGRFSQVTGYALWEGEDAGYQGDLGFNPRGAGVRVELERLLRSGAVFGGGADAVSSVTIQSASGGLSVFGGTDCVVAVAFRGSEGISEGLRGWLCGWMAQPGGA